MKISTKHGFLLVAALFFFFQVCSAQVKTKTFKDKIPDNLRPDKGLTIPELSIAASADLDKVKAEKEKATKNGTFKNEFALPVAVIRIRVIFLL